MLLEVCAVFDDVDVAVDDQRVQGLLDELRTVGSTRPWSVSVIDEMPRLTDREQSQARGDFATAQTTGSTVRVGPSSCSVTPGARQCATGPFSAESSAGRDDVGVTRVQAPRTRLVLPYVRETPPHGPPGYQPSAWSVADWHNSFETHHEGEIPVDVDELGLTVEFGEVDDPGVHKSIQVGPSPDDYLIVGRIDGQLLRPQRLEGGNVTR
jgi:hypothetical protein